MMTSFFNHIPGEYLDRDVLFCLKQEIKCKIDELTANFTVICLSNYKNIDI